MITSPNLKEILGQRDFIRFLGARTCGLIANQMLMVAVAWHMYDLTSSAWDLGLVGLFQFVPALLFVIPAGQVADLFHRGKIFALCMGLQALVAFLLCMATWFGFIDRNLVLMVSVALGVARAFQMPAQQALTPLLVPKTLLPRAVAMSSSAVQIASIGGPALGGVLFIGGAALVYVICTLLLMLACFVTLGVQYTHRPVSISVSLRSAFAGLAYVWQNKLLLGAASLDLFAVLLGGATALLPIYAKDILHIGPQGLGLLRASPALGALLMSLVLTRWPVEKRVGTRLLSAVGTFGLATVVFGFSESFWLSMVALMVIGAADTVSVVIRVTIMQLQTPDEIRGRVAAINGIFIGASNQLGEFESGTVADLLGPIFSVVSGGIGTILIALGWIRLFPALASRDLMSDQDEESNCKLR